MSLLKEVRSWEDRKGVLYARVDVPEFSEVTLRDVVIMSTRWWADFMSGIAALMGEKALRPVLYYSAYRMMKQHNQKGLLRMVREGKLPRKRIFEIACDIFSSLGFGEIISMEVVGGRMRIAVKDSFEARGRRAERPVCHFVAGMLSAILEDIFEMRIGPVIEESCAATGNDHCSFSAEVMEAADSI
ncbi:MAG: hypothetical protein BA066_07385 [Candidatus Korarchaeota archaeon NZ13-K]|nr:MAG: hypothetical protein BA066_07385 [Candidatus Korarchaeota archaeon NZ13-K]